MGGQPADRQGKIQPILSAVFPLTEVGDAALQVHHNLHEGKIGVLCLAPEEGLGIDDPEFREKVGEDRITLFRRHGRRTEMLLTEIDHVAIAVNDLEAAIA